MKIVIITHVSHGNLNNLFFAYAPYVREMNIWFKYVDEVFIVAPIEKRDISLIDLEYSHSIIKFIPIANINLLSVKSIFISIFKTPIICFKIFKAMKSADHIHLRCPGNIGLLGCFVQLLFPKKPKTAKYAGNWDPKAQQPWSYKLQKWILRHTFLTKNMQVLVYGEWENQSKNIKPFFTATFAEKDKMPVDPRSLGKQISFIFVGTLSKGKRPLYAIQLIEKLYKLKFNVILSIYGNGQEFERLEKYIQEHNLKNIVHLKGNQPSSIIKKAFQESHFLILPSKSEGWPKVVAEAMFWGCLPISTRVSCLPNMLDGGNRGLLLEMDFDKDVAQIISILNNPIEYQHKVQESVLWSRKFTLDLFENEIKALLV